MNEELYSYIYNSLVEFLGEETEEEKIVIEKLTSLATSGSQKYISDLEESVGHLKETIRRLTQEGQ
jgi:hypothetical protein